MEEIIIEKTRVNKESGEFELFNDEIKIDPSKDFSINKDQLDLDLSFMPQILVVYGNLHSDITSAFKRKEERARYIQAVTSANIRADMEKNKEKSTELKIQEKVIQNEDYQYALFDLNQCRADSIKIEHWWKAALIKAEMLKTLSYQMSAEISKM